MQCLNCGKDIPIDGNVCPWCHANKSSSRRALQWAWAIALALAGVAWLSWGALAAVLVFVVGVVFFGAVVRVVFRARSG